MWWGGGSVTGEKRKRGPWKTCSRFSLSWRDGLDDSKIPQPRPCPCAPKLYHSQKRVRPDRTGTLNTARNTRLNAWPRSDPSRCPGVIYSAVCVSAPHAWLQWHSRLDLAELRRTAPPTLDPLNTAHSKARPSQHGTLQGSGCVAGLSSGCRCSSGGVARVPPRRSGEHGCAG